jgi:hypothetical protein
MLENPDSCDAAKLNHEIKNCLSFYIDALKQVCVVSLVLTLLVPKLHYLHLPPCLQHPE